MARTPIHTGKLLAGELEKIGFSAKKLAGVLEVPANRFLNFWPEIEAWRQKPRYVSDSISAWRPTFG